jgi:hypothetical protein
MRLELVVGVRRSIAVDLVEDARERLALDRVRLVDERAGLASRPDLWQGGTRQLVELRHGRVVRQVESHDQGEHVRDRIALGATVSTDVRGTDVS